jgi:uncharacterized protein (TIGR03083 family)
MIHDSAVREGALPVTEILANLRSIVGSRRLAPTTSPREPLLDLLVHGQDIALALGRTRQMPLVAARDAADRVWTMRVPPRPWPLPKARLLATDFEFTRGQGPEIRGPIAALLLLLTGRPEGAREWAERTGQPWAGAPAPR